MEQPPDSISSFSLVRQHRRMLAQMNCYLTRESSILDFGCGDGKYVYEYRDAGFNAHGFDIRPVSGYRSPTDEQYFRFTLTSESVSPTDFTLDRAWYRIPFEDGSFDFIFSAETMEHVQDHDLAFREIARTLKKGGVAIHTFPARYIPIERHTLVPLGGVIQSYGWFLFWALMGIRNQYQQGVGPVQCANLNFNYAKTGTKYLEVRALQAICRRYFRDVILVPQLWESGDRGYSTFTGALLYMPVVRRFMHAIYNRTIRVVLFLRK